MVDCKAMDSRPVPIIHKILDKSGLQFKEIDFVEINEAFVVPIAHQEESSQKSDAPRPSTKNIHILFPHWS